MELNCREEEESKKGRKGKEGIDKWKNYGETCLGCSQSGEGINQEYRESRFALCRSSWLDE
jgi:hypothetical protein